MRDYRTIYLIRHGQIDIEDDQRRYIGQLDLPLSEEGVRQARYLQKELEYVDIGAVYCSDLLRSRQTAEIVAKNKAVAIIPCKNLREIYLGEWEGHTLSDIAQRFPDEFKARGANIADYQPPGGESFAHCSNRVIPAFREILQTTGTNILIIGHAGVNRLLFCYMLGMPLANLFRISQDLGCLNIIRYSSNGYSVELMNSVATSLPSTYSKNRCL